MVSKYANGRSNKKQETQDTLARTASKMSKGRMCKFDGNQKPVHAARVMENKNCLAKRKNKNNIAIKQATKQAGRQASKHACNQDNTCIHA